MLSLRCICPKDAAIRGAMQGQPPQWDPLDALMTEVEGAAPPAGPTAKLEHVTERFASLWSDLETEKQVRSSIAQRRQAEKCCAPS
jgi:hypothetical protein